MRCNWCAASAVTKPPITYVQRHDAMTTGELNALASVYRFIIVGCKSKEVAGPRQAGDLEDAKGSMHDSRRPQYTRT